MLYMALIAAAILSPACTGADAPPIDLADFDQVQQIASDHGVACGPTFHDHGTTRTNCVLGGTRMSLKIGHGFDGFAEFQMVRARNSDDPSNPACSLYDPSIRHGQLWAGDGFVITVGNTGPSNELELALADALGVDPTCELRGLPPAFG